MADWNQFEEKDRRRERDEDARPDACQVCETVLPDAVDGMLSEAEQRAFDRHVAGCVVCAQELEEAQRGAAWLGMLKAQAPEPGPALLERILAQTAAQTAAQMAAQTLSQTIGTHTACEAVISPAFTETSIPGQPAIPAPPAWNGVSLPRRQKAGWGVSAWASIRESFSLDFSLEWMKPLLQPRMAMTAAMAFFSIALTLNLTGVRLNEINASSLSPSSLRRTVADRSAAAVRGFQNMRVVYQAEAQVNDLRSTWQEDRREEEQRNEDRPAARQQEDAPKQKPDTPQGSSRLDFEPANPQGAGMARKGA